MIYKSKDGGFVFAGGKPYRMGLSLHGEVINDSEIINPDGVHFPILQGSANFARMTPSVRYVENPIRRSANLTSSLQEQQANIYWADHMLLFDSNGAIAPNFSLGFQDHRTTWIYVDGNGQPWLMEITSVGYTYPSSTITYSVQVLSPFGILGEEVAFTSLEVASTVVNTGYGASEIAIKDNGLYFEGCPTLTATPTGDRAVVNLVRVDTWVNLATDSNFTGWGLYPENYELLLDVYGVLSKYVILTVGALDITVSGNGDMTPGFEGQGITAAVSLYRDAPYFKEQTSVLDLTDHSGADPGYNPNLTGGTHLPKTISENITNEYTDADHCYREKAYTVTYGVNHHTIDGYTNTYDKVLSLYMDETGSIQEIKYKREDTSKQTFDYTASGSYQWKTDKRTWNKVGGVCPDNYTNDALPDTTHCYSTYAPGDKIYAGTYVTTDLTEIKVTLTVGGNVEIADFQDLITYDADIGDVMGWTWTDGTEVLPCTYPPFSSLYIGFFDENVNQTTYSGEQINTYYASGPYAIGMSLHEFGPSGSLGTYEMRHVSPEATIVDTGLATEGYDGVSFAQWHPKQHTWYGPAHSDAEKKTYI